MASAIPVMGGPAAVLCSHCESHYVYEDDPHDRCMRCRGFSHECELCMMLGKKAKERLTEYLVKHLAPLPSFLKSDNQNSITSGTAVASMGKPSSSQPNADPDSQPVSMGELRAFQQQFSQNMKEMMVELLSKSQSAGKDVSSDSQEGPSSKARTGASMTVTGPELFVHPDSQSEGEIDEDNDDVMSVRSSWDYKRSHSAEGEAEGDNESVLSIDKVEGEPLSASETERYVDMVATLIDKLDITDGVKVPKARSRILSSRCKDKGPQALLPMDEHHRSIIDGVWKNDPAQIGLYRKATRDRYKLVETDFLKYLKSSKIKDEYLVQELERSGIKVQVKAPKLPNKELAAIDSKVSHIEVQSSLGIACAVSQSWMLQFLSAQIAKLDKVLLQGLQPDDYKSITDQVDLKQLYDVAVFAQDAAIDTLDLQARQAAEAKAVRRSMWVDLTRWAQTIKTAVKRFPTVGDGTLCGPNLKDKLESYRLTSKALEASHFSAPTKRSSSAPKRGASNQGSMPPPKRMRFDRPFEFKSNSRARGRGRGSSNFRGQGRASSASASFPKANNSSMSG